MSDAAFQLDNLEEKMKLKWVKTSNTGEEQPRHFGTANEVKLSKLSGFQGFSRHFVLNFGENWTIWTLPGLQNCPGLLGRCGSKASMFVVGSRRLGTDGALVSAGAPAHQTRSIYIYVYIYIHTFIIILYIYMIEHDLTDLNTSIYGFRFMIL